MAACTELEIEEKSSEESSCNAVHANDVAFQGVNSNSRCTAACSIKSQKELDSQLKGEPETRDLKKLSDEQFLHLLKEASTFNKPNNQESILLKQLRKEVADTDSCEQVRCGDSNCVSKRTDRKCSKVPCGSVQNSIESPTNSFPEKDHNLNNIAPLSSRTLKSTVHKKDKEPESQMLLNSRDRVAFIEVDPNTQWPTKARKTSLENQSVLESVKPISNNRKYSEKELTPTLTFGQDFKSSASNANSDELSFNNAKSQFGNMPVEFKLEVNPLPTLLVGNYQNFAREIRVPTSNSSILPQNSSKESPGIELTEFKRTKENDQKTMDASTSKTQPNNQLSNSKFYVNCNEVDTTVSFPLKLVSSVDERNGSGIICDAVNDQLKHRIGFPCFSWPRPQQVQSFLNSADGDAQLQNDGENNSNPFSRAARAANLTSFVSATLLDYPNTALIPDNQTSKLEWSHRKHKRTRNHMENSKVILSQNIEGHRGNEDIDSLVKFIEAADKNDKAFTRGNNGNNHLLVSKTNAGQEALKRKINGKETKNKNGCLSRKKLSQSNSDDSSSQFSDNKQDPICLDSKMGNSESECSDDSGCNKVKNASAPPATETTPLLDINSNIMEVDQSFSVAVETPIACPLPADDKMDQSSTSISPDDSSFAADFYSVTESAPPSTEESGFCIVKKKQRKKHQGKRSENYRWHSAAARVRQSTSGEHDYYSKEPSHDGNSIILLPASLVQRNQCSKQDSRRKSTSSVPQSEQSSADNSDLDSVHSLPVRGSAPHPTKPHPHTTPSSSSSTPQASYADIARMPVSSISSKLNSPPTISGGSIASGKSSNSSDKSCSASEILNDEELTSSVNAKLNTTNIEHSAANSLNRSTREINTQTEPLIDDDDDSPLKSESDLEKSCSSVGSEDSKTCPLCPKGKVCSCSKFQKNVSKKDASEYNLRPAVLMMGNIPTTEASDISFGVDLTEILQMSADESDSAKNKTAPASVDLSESVEDEPSCSQHHSNGCNCNKFRVSNSTNSSFDNSNLCKVDVKKRVSALHKVSSRCIELHLSSGQRLRFSDKEVDVQKFNHSQLVDLLTREWKNVQSEYPNDGNKTEGNVIYYDVNSY